MKQKKKAPSKQKGGTTPPKGGSTGNTSPTSPSPGLPSSSDAEKITNSSPSPDYTKSSSSEGTVPPSSSSPVPPESSPSHSPSSLTTPSPGAEEPQSRDTQSNQQLPLSSPAVSTPPSSSSSSSSSSSGTTTTVHASNTSSSSSSTESAPSSVPIHQEKEQDSSFLSPSSSPIPSSRMEEERNDSSSTINLKDPSDRENFNPVDKDTRSPDHDGDGNSSSSSLPPPSSAHTSTPKVSQGPSSSSASANTTASATPDKNDENPGDAEEEEDSSGHVSNDGIEKRPSPSRDTKSYQTLRSQRTIPKRQQSKYCREMIPRPHHLSTMKLPSSSAVSPGDLHKGKNGERKQENDEEEEGSTEEEEVKRGEKSVSPGGVAVRGDGEGDEGVGSAGEIGSSSAGTTAPTRGGSVVMNTDLGGFYQKLLGNNWRERLEDMNEEDFLGAFNEGGGEDPGEVGVGGVPGGDSAGMADSSMGGVGIGSGPSSSSADDDLNLPDTHHGKMRQRIRRRDVTVAKDISDQVADDLHLGEDDEPLITPEDIAEIRANAWTPAGEGLPVLSEIELGYHRAWDVGKKGCLAVKVDGIWDSAVKGNKMRFFVMDGTDTESFLTFYSKSDLQAARGLQSEKLGIITAWDMRDGYWNYSKKKVFIQRSDRKNKDCILEGFTAEFFDAMLLCIWEMCVQGAIEQLKHQRRRERNKRRQSLAGGGGDLPSHYRGTETRRVSAALVTFKDVHRTDSGRKGARGDRGGTKRSPEELKRLVEVHRKVVKQICAEWRKILMKDTRRRPSIARRRVRIKRLEGGSGSLVKRTSSYRPKGGGGEGGGGLKGGLRKKLSKAGSVVYIDDSSAASGEGKKKSILKRVGSARSVTQKDSLEDDVDHSSSSSTSHDSDDEDDTKNGGNVKRKEEEGDVVEERSLCRKSKGSIRLDGSAVTRSESGLKKTKKGSNRSRSTGASFSDEDEDAHRVEGEDDDEEVESHCKDQSTSGPSSRSCQGGSRGEGEDRRKDVDALEEDDEGEKESRQALMASSDPSSVDHQQSKTAREISSTQSEELGEIRRQLMKAQSAQQQKDSTGTLSMNGAERDGVEEKIRRRSSSSRNVNSSSLSPLHSDSLSSRQVDDLLDHGDIVCGMNNSRSPPVGSNRGGRGGSSSTSSGKAAGIQASRSKRGSVIGGGAGVTKKLSKYKTLNRVPPAQPEGNETPLLTPGEMTPRDPESERPMFG